MITATEPRVRNQSLEAVCSGFSTEQLLEECAALDQFRRQSDNLYERVRALFFLYALHRFHLPPRLAGRTRETQHATRALIPFKGYHQLLQRRFEEAIECFLTVQNSGGPS